MNRRTVRQIALVLLMLALSIAWGVSLAYGATGCTAGTTQILSATASSTYDASNVATKAIDCSSVGNWSTAAVGGTSWLQIGLGQRVQVTDYWLSIQGGLSGSVLTTIEGRMPKTWYIQGSDDGATWVTGGVVGNDAGWTAAGQRKHYTAAFDKGYYLYRIFVVVNQGDPQFTNIGELEVGPDTLYTPPTAGGGGSGVWGAAADGTAGNGIYLDGTTGEVHVSQPVYVAFGVGCWLVAVVLGLVTGKLVLP